MKIKNGLLCMTFLFMLAFIPSAMASESAYLLNDAFDSNTLSEYSVSADDSIVSIENGSLNFKGPASDASNKSPVFSKSVDSGDAGIVVIDYRVTNLGNYCPNTLQVTFANGVTVDICRNGHVGDTTEKTGIFKAVIDINNGIANTYFNSAEEPISTVEIPQKAVKAIGFKTQTYRDSTTSYDYIKAYAVSDYAGVSDNESTEIDYIKLNISPIIKDGIDIKDYISIDDVQIAEIEAIDKGIYKIQFAEPLEYNTAYSVKINNLECDYDIIIDRSVDFTTRPQKNEYKVSLADVNFSECVSDSFSVVKKINIDILNELDEVEPDGYVIAALYNSNEEMTLLNPYSIKLETQSVQKNLTLRPSNFNGDMRIEVYVVDNLADLNILSDRTVYEIKLVDGVYETDTKVYELTEQHESEFDLAYTADYEPGNGIFTVSGEGEKTIVVLKGYGSDEEPTVYERNNIYYTRRLAADEEGIFNIAMPDFTLNYDVYAKCGLSGMQKVTIVHYSSEEYANALKAINEAADDFGTVINKHSDKFALGDITVKEAEIVKSIRDSQEGFKSYQELINSVECSRMIATVNGGDAEGFIKYINEKYPFDEGLYQVYNSVISSGAKEAVLSDIASSDFRSVDDVKLNFTRFVILDGIEKAEHYSQTANIIEKLGERYAGLNLAVYNSMSNKSKVASELTAKSFESYDALKSSFDSLVSKYNSTSGGASSGGSGGSGSGGGTSSGRRPASTKTPDNTSGGRTGVGENTMSYGTGVSSQFAGESKEKNNFEDIDSVPWAIDAINKLYTKGIISGRSDLVFAPNDNITRGELAKMVAVAFEMDLNQSSAYEDVAEDDWRYPYVAAVSAAGVMVGVSDTEFNPDTEVTREMIATVLLRAAGYEGKILPIAEGTFSDMEEAADYAREAIGSLAKTGIIEGTGENKFSPKDVCTRAQCAKMLCGILDY